MKRGGKETRPNIYDEPFINTAKDNVETVATRAQRNAKDACYARSIFATYVYAYLLEDTEDLTG